MTAITSSSVRRPLSSAAQTWAAALGLALAEFFSGGAVATAQVAVPAPAPKTTTDTSRLAKEEKPVQEAFKKKRTSPRSTFAEVEETSDNPETKQKVDSLIARIYEPETTLTVDPRRSKLIRTRRPVSRFSVTDPGILEVVQFGPTEFELIGGSTGETTLTLWFDGQGGEVLRYYVRVERRDDVESKVETEYGRLQLKINELFPNSMIQLIPVADKLIVRGQ